MAWHIERRMQSEHSVRNVSSQTVKANEKAGMVSTLSAEQKKKCFKLQTQTGSIVVSKLQCFSVAQENSYSKLIPSH